MIFFFTDFGPDGIYVGQMQGLVLTRTGQPAIDLLNNAPVSNPRASAYLLAALSKQLPEGAVVVAVVDPGVGSDRPALVFQAKGRYWVGPDNGLLSRVIAEHPEGSLFRLTHETSAISDSFHGRDVFVPAVVRLLNGDTSGLETWQAGHATGYDWADDLAEIIFIDHFGNGFTGLKRESISLDQQLLVGGEYLRYARTFSSVGEGQGFWYFNSCGLVELAVNQGSAERLLGLEVGMPVSIR